MKRHKQTYHECPQYSLTHSAQMVLQNSDCYWFKAKNKVLSRSHS